MRNPFSAFKPVVLLLALVLALALSACGGDDDAPADVGDLGPDPATMAPAESPFYAEAVIRPGGEMADNLESALSKFGVDDPGGMLRDALDQELADSPDSGGITFSDDIEPWLGARAGGFLSSYDPATEMGEGAVAIATTDPDAAQAFIDKAAEADSSASMTDETYEGADYKLDSEGNAAVGVTGDFLVVGTAEGFKQAVDAGAGDSLADSDEASEALDAAPEDSIFSGYVNTAAAIDLIESSGALAGPQLKQFQEQIAGYSEAPVDFWATVDGDAVTFAGSGPAPADGSEPSDLVSTFPADSWLAFAGGDVSSQLQTSLDQFKQGFEQSAPTGLDIDPFAEFKKATGLDLETDFNWLGSVGGFVQGTSIFGLGGGLVIESTDDDAASATVDKLEAALQKERSLQISSTDTGFAIQVVGAPVGAEVAVQDGKFVVAVGGATVADVLSPSETLGDSDRFGVASESLGEDVTPSFFLDFAPILALAESTGQASSDPDYQMAKPYLDALDYFVAGSKVDGDRSTGSIVLGLKEASESESTSAVITP